MGLINECKICGYKGKIVKHLKNVHNLTQMQYFKEHLKEGIDYIECKICGDKMENIKIHLKKHQGMACDDYKEKYPDAIMFLNKTIEGKEGEDYLECKICNAKVNNLWHHLRVHNISILDYKEKFPESLIRLYKKIEGKEGEDYLICKICNTKHKGLQSHLLYSHNITVSEYKEKYGNDLIFSKKSSINFGRHMKTDEYKQMFSEKIKGEKNINHKSKTTLLQRQEKSPFSIEFWKKKYPNDDICKINDIHITFVNSSLSKREFDTRLDYYIKRGFSEEDALILLKNRQTTFSLEKCIEKYGEELGKRKWIERQEKWFKNYKKQNYSKISQKLFIEIYEKYIDNKDNIYFAILDKNKEYDMSGRNYEYRLKLKNCIIRPDFFIKNINKIIEFDGTYYHRKNSENIKREIYRDSQIIDSGYTVLHIKEYDYNKNKEQTIQKCIDFINDKTDNK